MSSIERTAYPRFATGRILKEQELEQYYSLTPDELCKIHSAPIQSTLQRQMVTFI